MKILVLLKTTSLRDILSESLRDKQHEVESHSTREQGLRMMRDHSIDALVWDPSVQNESDRKVIREAIDSHTIQIVIPGNSEATDSNQSRRSVRSTCLHGR